MPGARAAPLGVRICACPQYDFGKPSTRSAMCERISCGLTARCGRSGSRGNSARRGTRGHSPCRHASASRSRRRGSRLRRRNTWRHWPRRRPGRLLAAVVGGGGAQAPTARPPRARSSARRAGAGCPGSGRSAGRRRRALRHSGGAGERGAAEPDRFGGDQDALRVHAVQDVVEALAFLADAVLSRHLRARR